jgi:hypothetical protein
VSEQQFSFARAKRRACGFVVEQNDSAKKAKLPSTLRKTLNELDDVDSRRRQSIHCAGNLLARCIGASLCRRKSGLIARRKA